MPPLLPQNPQVAVTRRRQLPDEKAASRLQHLLIVTPPKPGVALWRQLPKGEDLAVLARRRRDGVKGPLRTHLPGTTTGVTLGEAHPDDSVFAWHTAARKLATAALGEDPAAVGIAVVGYPAEAAAQLQSALAGALLAAAFRLPTSRRETTPSHLRRIVVFAAAEAFDADRIKAEAEGNDLARWLTALPPNVLDAGAFKRVASELAEREGWACHFFDERALARKGAGAFLAVAQGNPHRDAGILRLSWRPGSKRAAPKLALVGKGICFDTGGTNLKPFKSMLDMHEDMQGSAVALGTLLTLTRLRYPEPVDCWLAVTENRIGPEAYKSRDVVTAANGVTIEVIHTDAEGRMVLADTLALAAADEPALIIDYATLTGTCVSALTNRYSGVFSNRTDLYPALVAAGRSSGERVWGFPMDEDFDEELESAAADVAQCCADGSGDHIHASRFLGRFVGEDRPWVHVDLAAGHRKGGLGLIPTAVTGFGVRYTTRLLLDDDLLARAAAADGE
jgi:leucyl aminopeptidase